MNEQLQRLGRDLHTTIEWRLRRQMLPHYLAAAVLAVGITVAHLPAHVSASSTALVIASLTAATAGVADGSVAAQPESELAATNIAPRPIRFTLVPPDTYASPPRRRALGRAGLRLES